MSTGMRLCAAALMSFAVAAFAADDGTFIKETVSSNLAEVQLGRLAQQKSENDTVRDFAGKLVEDHREALDKARELAQEHGVTPPSEATAEQQRDYDRLSQLDGEEFDREFISHMVDAHRMNIQKFEQQARAGESSVAEFAEETLPTLREHLREAQAIEGRELQSRAER